MNVIAIVKSRVWRGKSVPPCVEAVIEINFSFRVGGVDTCTHKHTHTRVKSTHKHKHKTNTNTSTHTVLSHLERKRSVTNCCNSDVVFHSFLRAAFQQLNQGLDIFMHGACPVWQMSCHDSLSLKLLRSRSHH